VPGKGICRCGGIRVKLAKWAQFRAEHGSHREAVDPIDDKQRIVHVLVVVAMKEA
jgi:hypothetical protein